MIFSRLQYLGLIVIWLSILIAPLGHSVEYDIELCCEICPAAKNIENYNTSLLRSVRLLIDGRDGWLFRTENDLLEEFGPSDEYLEELHKFVKLLNEQGTDLALFYIPTRGLVHPDKIIDHRLVEFDWSKAKKNYLESLKRFKTAGILVPDMESFFMASHPDFYFKRDHHWSPAGANVSASLMADAVKRRDYYQALNKTEFVNSRVGILRRKGQFERAVRRLCGFDYPNQFVPEFSAARVDSEEDESKVEDSLFGDSSLPEVVLIGTSNSKGRQNFNFEGFLKQYLSLDIYNESIEGGGFDGSFIQYMHSDLYQSGDRPELIIWELPSYYDLNEKIFFRRLNALTQNGCAQQEPLMEDRITLGPGKNEILFNGNGKVENLRSGRLIADIQFEDENTRVLKIDIWYVNGRKETIKIEDSERINIGGRFVFELNSLGEWNDFLYLSMDIEVDNENAHPKPQSQVSAQLCHKTY